MNKKNIGSDFNDFLRDEGVYDEVHVAALKEVLADRTGSQGRNTVRTRTGRGSPDR